MLRSDDGVGWHVADRLASDTRFDGVTVLRRHQLTPELALDVSRADLVALVDASADRPAGTFTIEPADASEGRPPRGHIGWSPAPSSPSPTSCTVRRPRPTWSASARDRSRSGDRLSPALEAAVPDVVEALAELLAARTGPVEHAGVGHA